MLRVQARAVWLRRARGDALCVLMAEWDGRTHCLRSALTHLFSSQHSLSLVQFVPPLRLVLDLERFSIFVVCPRPPSEPSPARARGGDERPRCPSEPSRQREHRVGLRQRPAPRDALPPATPPPPPPPTRTPPTPLPPSPQHFTSREGHVIPRTTASRWRGQARRSRGWRSRSASRSSFTRRTLWSTTSALFPTSTSVPWRRRGLLRAGCLAVCSRSCC